MNLYKKTYHCNLGNILMFSDDDNLLGLWFEGQKYFGSHYDTDIAREQASLPICKAQSWLDAYFAGENPSIDNIPIKLNTTDFRHQVMAELQKIPYGKTTTYTEISNNLQPKTNYPRNKSRAVGNAVAHNPLILIIPCHRVIGSDGSLIGYAGGIERKQALLAFERRNKT